MEHTATAPTSFPASTPTACSGGTLSVNWSSRVLVEQTEPGHSRVMGSIRTLRDQLEAAIVNRHAWGLVVVAAAVVVVRAWGIGTLVSLGYSDIVTNGLVPPPVEIN